MTSLPFCTRLLSTLCALFLAAALIATEAPAQGLGLAAKSDKPVTIDAEKGVEWRQKEKVYIARGNAIAKQGKTSIRADVLTAHYRESKAKKGRTEIYKVTAKGNVLIKTAKEKLTGQRGVYNVDTGIFVLTGNNLKLTSEKQTITARDRIQYNSTALVANVVGNAVVVEGERRIRADRFIAYLYKNKAGKTKLKKVRAIGNVVITTKTEIARGKRGDYNAKTEIATLTGGVKLTRCENQLNGERAIVNMKTGVSRMVGRVRILLIPRDKEKGPCDQGAKPNLPGATKKGKKQPK